MLKKSFAISLVILASLLVLSLWGGNLAAAITPSENTCGPNETPLQPNQTKADPALDVAIPHIDIIEVSTPLTGESLTAVLTLRDVPPELTFNREGVPDYQEEYSWGVFVDIDNNLETGSQTSHSKGADYWLNANHHTTSNDVPITLPIEDGVSVVIFEYTADNTWTSIGSGIIQVDSTADTLTVTGNIPFITPTSRLVASAYDYDEGNHSRDNAGCVPSTSPPTATPEPISTSIGPAGGSLTSNDSNQSTTIQFPAGAVSSTTIITYAYQAPLQTAPLVGINHFFDLQAAQNSVSISSFNQPVTVVVRYTDQERGPVIADSLNLYWLSGTTWMTEGISTIGRDDNVVTSTTDHFTLFAVLGETNAIFLPVMLK